MPSCMILAVDVHRASQQDGDSDGQPDRYQSYFVQAMLLWQQLSNEKQVEIMYFLNNESIDLL